MRVLFIFGPSILCLLLTTLIIRSNFMSGILTARGFALLFSTGLTTSIMLLFFLDLVVIGIRIDLGLIFLGLGIGLLNLLLGIPISYFVYKYILQDHIKRFLLSQQKEKDKQGYNN
jgi:hypothetical protein